MGKPTTAICNCDTHCCEMLGSYTRGGMQPLYLRSHVLVVQLAQAGGHFAAAGAGGGDHHQAALGLNVVVFPEAVVGDDERHVGGIAGDNVVAVDPDAQRLQPFLKGVGHGLAPVVGDDHAAHVQADAAKSVDQAQGVVVIGDPQIAPAFAALDVVRRDGDDDFGFVLHFQQHPHLAVRLKARQYPGGMVLEGEDLHEHIHEMLREYVSATVASGLEGGRAETQEQLDEAMDPFTKLFLPRGAIRMDSLGGKADADKITQVVMELEKIRIFLAVADTRSFSEAARRLYISHSTTSRAVSALEEELGARLIDREENRVVGLTAAGELLRSGGEALLRQADTLAAACAGTKATSGREK